MGDLFILTDLSAARSVSSSTSNVFARFFPKGTERAVWQIPNLADWPALVPKIDGMFSGSEDGLPDRLIWTDLMGSQIPEVATLAAAIEEWSLDFNLNADWVRQIAVETLFHWLRSVSPDDQWHGSTWELRPWDIPEAHGVDHIFAPAIRDSWWFEDESKFRKRVNAAFEKQRDEYISKMSHFYKTVGYNPSECGNHKDRFDWLAAYQTKKMSLGNVMKTFKPSISQSAVQKALQDLTKRINLPLRRSIAKSRCDSQPLSQQEN